MVRDVLPADIEALTAIYNDVIGEGGLTGDTHPVTLDQRRAWCGAHQGRYAVMVKLVDGEVAGYAALSPYRNGRGAFEETCEISYFLDRRHRGQGFGGELIDHAIRRAGASGFRLLVAIALGCNQRSLDILGKYGFVVSGRIPGAAKTGGVYVDHVFLSRPVQ